MVLGARRDRPRISSRSRRGPEVGSARQAQDQLIIRAFNRDPPRRSRSGALRLPLISNCTETQEMRDSHLCRFSAADWLPNSESSSNESCLYSDSYGHVGSEFRALPIFRSRDENPCWLFNRLRSPESQALKINSAQMAGFLSGDFGREIATFCVISGEIRRYPAKSGDCRIILKRTPIGIVGIQLQ